MRPYSPYTLACAATYEPVYVPPLIWSEPTCAVQVEAGAVPAVLVGEALDVGEAVSLAVVGVAEGLPRRLSAKKSMSSLCSAAYGRKLTRAEVRARRTKTKSETLRVRQDDGLVLQELLDTDVDRVERGRIAALEPRTTD